MLLPMYIILNQSYLDKQRRAADSLRVIQANQPGYSEVPLTRIVWDFMKVLAGVLSAVAVAGLIVYGLIHLGNP